MHSNRQFYEAIRELRRQGYTYTEINGRLDTNIPKSSLNYICKGIELSSEQKTRIENATRERLVPLRAKAVLANRKKLEAKLAGYKFANKDLAKLMQNNRVKMIALAMLYLGEGAKWQRSRAPKLASTDPEIIRLYIRLLNDCYGVTPDKLRARAQIRADQDPEELKGYWSRITGIKLENFYPAYVDKRTIGKTTEKLNYKGVCTIMCAGTHIQLELAEIAGIIYKAMRGISAVG